MREMMPNLDRFLSTTITEAAATSVVSDEIGMALPILLNTSPVELQPILTWARETSRLRGFEFVYIFKGTHQGRVRHKIGKAKCIKDRRSVFEVKLPFDIDLVAAFRVKNARALEADLHRMWRFKRVGGEWFDLADLDFDCVCRSGMAAELQDLADVVREAGAPQPADLMSDDEYIAYLESLLAMQGVTFSRVRAVAGGASGH